MEPSSALVYNEGMNPNGWRLVDALAKGPLGLKHVPGSTLGAYVIDAELGRGGMGAVLRARHMQTGQLVALKVLLQGSAAEDKARRRFEREAGLGQVLEGVIPVLDMGEQDGLQFIAFELVEGGTLDEFTEGADVDDVVDLLLEVSRILGRAHARGVVHRDLKPGNVMVRAADRRVFLADLGLGRDMNLSSSLTKTGGLLGTPAYMSPEQIKGQPATPASDVFALGVMLYQALTSETPFPAPNLTVRLARMLTHPPPPPSELRPEVPRSLDAVVLRCMKPKPTQRYADANEVTRALLAYRSDAVRGDGPARSVLALGGAVLLLLALGAGWFLRGRAGPPVAPPPAGAADGSAKLAPSLGAQALLAAGLLERDPQRRHALAQASADREHSPEAERLLAEAVPWRLVALAGGGPYGREVSGHDAVSHPDGGVLLYAHSSKNQPGGLWRIHQDRWTELSVTGMQRPRPTSGHAYALDTLRNRLLVLGGVAPGTTYPRETWSWDLETREWTIHDVRGRPHPGGRTWHALAYDATRDVVVLYGGRGPRGYLDDTWEWDGARWSQLKPAHSPGELANHAMVYEPVSERVLLFGGHLWGQLRDEFWAWDGADWTELSPPGPRPSRRQGPCLAAVGDGRLLLYGGGTPEPGWQSGDTWVYGPDRRWRRRYPPQAPAPRYDALNGWDSERKVLLVASGRVGSSQYGTEPEAWEYAIDGAPAPPDPLPPVELAPGRVGELAALLPILQLPIGESKLAASEAFARAHPDLPRAAAIADALRPWVEVTQGAGGPGARGQAAAVFHPGRGGLVLGGRSAKEPLAELWSWGGRGWRAVPLKGEHAPPATLRLQAAYDPIGERLLTFGGTTGGELPGLLRRWDGTSWGVVDPGPGEGPTGRTGHGVAFDEVRRELLVFGGRSKSGYLGDLWRFDGVRWTRGPDGPPPRSRSSMAFDGQRTIVFGGKSPETYQSNKAYNVTLRDTWAWNGEGWRQLPTGTLDDAPAGTHDGAMVGIGGGRVLLYGGRGTSSRIEDQTWVLEGDRWTRRTPLRTPPPLIDHAMWYDVDRETVVVFGGTTEEGSSRAPFAGLWEYRPDLAR